MRRLHKTVLLLCTLLAACGRSGESGSDSAAAIPAGKAPEISGGSVDSVVPAKTAGPCPRTGRWAICSLEKRLEQSGFVLREGEGKTSRLGFSVPPKAYTLGRAKLEVFIYPDEAALTRDLAQMDTIAAAPHGKSNDWEIPPRFMRSANLAAVFLTRNEQQAERLTLAITAGPPQR